MNTKRFVPGHVRPLLQLTWITALALIIVGCKSENTESDQDDNGEEISTADVLYEEVIAIHDEVMPHLARIATLKSEIEEKITELENADLPSEEELQALRDQMITLDEADEAMMDWMRNFNSNQEGWAEDSVLRYLEAEKLRITDVGVKVDEAIRKAREMLEKE